MQISDLAEWVRGLDEPSVGAAAGDARQTPRLVRGDRARLSSLDRPSGHALRRRGAADEDDPPPGSSLTDVTYVFDEPTVGLHPHDIQRMNGLLAAAARQGQHRPGRRAQAGDDRDRRPRRRPRARRGHGRRQVCFEGTVEGCAPARRSPAVTSTTGRRSSRRCGKPTGARDPRRDATQPAGRDVDIPLGVLCVVTGVAGSGKSSLIHGSMPEGDGVVSVDQTADPRLAAQQPGDVHRTARPDPHGVREGQRRQAGAVQRQLRGRLPGCNGNGVIYTELGFMATRGDRLRGVRGKAVPGQRAGVQARRQETSARCSRCR